MVGALVGFFAGASLLAEEITPLVVRVEQGDVAGVVRDYRVRYEPSTPSGLVALRQIAVEVLHQGLSIDDPYERNAVAGILGKWGDPAALWVLSEALHSSDPMERRVAADILGDIATPGAVAILRRFYEEGPKGRFLALSALYRTRDRTALALYLDALNSPDAHLRVLGIRGLADLNVQEARAYLRSLLEQEADPFVGSNVACALALLGDPRGLKYLAAQLHNPRENVRDLVAGLLGSLSDPAAAPLLRKALQDVSETVRTTAGASLTRFKDPLGLPWVEKALKHPDFRVRLAAAISFARMDYETARPLILRSLASQDALVRAHAFKVIGENRDFSAASLVKEALRRETDPYVQSQGAWVLGQIGSTEEIPLLLDLLAKEQKEVRHASAEALVMLCDRLLKSQRPVH